MNEHRLTRDMEKLQARHAELRKASKRLLAEKMASKAAAEKGGRERPKELFVKCGVKRGEVKVQRGRRAGNYAGKRKR